MVMGAGRLGCTGTQNPILLQVGLTMFRKWHANLRLLAFCGQMSAPASDQDQWARTFLMFSHDVAATAFHRCMAA